MPVYHIHVIQCLIKVCVNTHAILVWRWRTLYHCIAMCKIAWWSNRVDSASGIEWLPHSFLWQPAESCQAVKLNLCQVGVLWPVLKDSGESTIHMSRCRSNTKINFGYPLQWKTTECNSLHMWMFLLSVLEMSKRLSSELIFGTELGPSSGTTTSNLYVWQSNSQQ
jgi:hypothetical protein